MKVSQNDLIISIVAVVLGIGFSVAFLFMRRPVQAPAAPVPVNTTAAALPTPNIVYANSLPGASGGGAPGAGGGGGGRPAAAGGGLSGPARAGGPASAGGGLATGDSGMQKPN